MYDLVQLEKAGIPTVDVVTDAMESEAHFRAVGLGLTGLAFAVVPAALSQADIDTVNKIGDDAMAKVVYGLTRPVAAAPVTRSATPKIIEITAKPAEDVLEKWFAYAVERKWTDGFPLTPPTEERVAAMLKGTKRKPTDVIADVPPFFASGTVEKIAINAVMAGAKPEYMEVIIAAVAAVSDPVVHMAGCIATTDPGNAPLLVINGPIVNELGLNSSWSVMGPGNRANSTIGRAMSLCLRNIGGADTPGGFQQHTWYLPHDYSLVLAQPYPKTDGDFDLMSVQLGFKADQNVVFVMPTEGPTGLSPFDSPTQPISAADLLKNWVDEMADLWGFGGRIGIVQFAPEHARILAAEGWTVNKIKEYFFNTSYNPKIEEERKKNGLTTRGPYHAAKTMGLSRKLKYQPFVENPIVFGEEFLDDLFITVAGAPVGGHGFFMPRSSHGKWAAREVGTLATSKVLPGDVYLKWLKEPKPTPGSAPAPAGTAAPAAPSATPEPAGTVAPVAPTQTPGGPTATPQEYETHC